MNRVWMPVKMIWNLSHNSLSSQYIEPKLSQFESLYFIAIELSVQLTIYRKKTNEHDCISLLLPVILSYRFKKNFL